jgi:hypothetical protein
MDCQGGPLGFADVWHLQQGRTVYGDGGKIYTPSLLTGDGSRLVGYRSWVSPHMLRCLKHAPEGLQSPFDWKRVTVSDVEASALRCTCSYRGCGIDVLSEANRAQTPTTRWQRYAAAMDAVTGGTCPADLVSAVIAVADAEQADTEAEGAPKPTPCDEFPCEDGGEPCDRHEREWAHEEGDHSLCEQEVTCEVSYTSDQLRNAILARAIDGSRNMLKELERRASANAVAALENHRTRYKEGLRRADEKNNALMEEVQRYADGKERPVLWSVYSKVLQRANNAEARVKVLEAELGIGPAWICPVCSKENHRRVCLICETDRPDPEETP